MVLFLEQKKENGHYAACDICVSVCKSYFIIYIHIYNFIISMLFYYVIYLI